MKFKQLSSVCEIKNGYAFKSSDYKNDGIPLLRISNFNDSEVYFDDDQIYVDEEFLKTKKDFIVTKGDVLIALSGATTGKYGVYNFDFPSLLNQRIGLVKAGISTDLDSKYFFFYLNILKSYILKNAGGAAQPNISTKKIGDFQIPLPPLETQKHIAQILDDAAALRDKTAQLIKEYDALAQSIFLDMFGDPVKNEKGFQISTIKEHCSVKGGKRVPKGEKLVKENTGYPYIKAGNIKNGKVNSDDLEYLLPETRRILKNYTVNEGDVCITVVGAKIGDIGIVPNDLHLANLTENANKLLIRDNKILNNFYLSFYMQMEFVQTDIRKKTMMVGVPKLALFRIEQLSLLLPPIALQNQFAEKIALIEQQKELAKQELAASEDLFNCLLQKAFKGELA